MKVRRYVAPDMRTALAKVREEQGPDVVILSNKPVDGGVELITSDEYVDSVPLSQTPHRSSIRASAASPEQGVAHLASGKQAAATNLWTHEPVIEQMRAEMNAMRSLLERQISGLAWGDFGRRCPIAARTLRQLFTLGISSPLASQLVKELPDEIESDAAWRRVLALLAHRIPIATDDLMETGGCVALVGPTGVGKSSLIAKLAAQFTLEHGQESVAMITADNERIGAHEQLRNFGRILGIPVWTVESSSELTQALDDSFDRRLVLVDTPGLSHRDPRLMELANTLSCSRERLKVQLVLSASTQSRVLEETAAKYAAVHPTGCMITKIDESTSLGAVLSAAIYHHLPIGYTSAGQRVPEDLTVATAHGLVSQAVVAAKGVGAALNELQLEEVFMEIAPEVAH